MSYKLGCSNRTHSGFYKKFNGLFFNIRMNSVAFIFKPNSLLIKGLDIAHYLKKLHFKIVVVMGWRTLEWFTLAICQDDSDTRAATLAPESLAYLLLSDEQMIIKSSPNIIHHHNTWYPRGWHKNPNHPRKPLILLPKFGPSPHPAHDILVPSTDRCSNLAHRILIHS